MWLENPMKTLSVAVGALFFGACIVTFGLLALSIAFA